MIVCFHLALLIWNPPPDRLDPLTPQEQRDSVPKHVRDSPQFQQNPREMPRFSQDLCDAAKRNDAAFGHLATSRRRRVSSPIELDSTSLLS